MPECCGYEMLEIEDGPEVVGYECAICHKQIDLNGEESL